VPDYELDLISKGTHFPDEAILLAVGEEEDETPHDWQMFFLRPPARKEFQS
jgi:hypothetical protein